MDSSRSPRSWSGSSGARIYSYFHLSANASGRSSPKPWRAGCQSWRLESAPSPSWSPTAARVSWSAPDHRASWAMLSKHLSRALPYAQQWAAPASRSRVTLMMPHKTTRPSSTCSSALAQLGGARRDPGSHGHPGSCRNSGGRGRAGPGGPQPGPSKCHGAGRQPGGDVGLEPALDSGRAAPHRRWRARHPDRGKCGGGHLRQLHGERPPDPDGQGDRPRPGAGASNPGQLPDHRPGDLPGHPGAHGALRAVRPFRHAAHDHPVAGGCGPSAQPAEGPAARRVSGRRPDGVHAGLGHILQPGLHRPRTRARVARLQRAATCLARCGPRVRRPGHERDLDPLADPGPVAARLKLIRRLLVNSLPYCANYVVHVTYTLIDTVILATMTTTVVVGWDGASCRLLSSLFFIPVILSTALLPRLAAAYDGNLKKLQDLTRPALELVMVASLPVAVGAALVSGHSIAVLSGPDCAL